MIYTTTLDHDPIEELYYKLVGKPTDHGRIMGIDAIRRNNGRWDVTIDLNEHDTERRGTRQLNGEGEPIKVLYYDPEPIEFGKIIKYYGLTVK
jgi:hypothetical protein